MVCCLSKTEENHCTARSDMRALRGHGSLSVADHKEAPTRCNSWIYMCHHWSTYVCIPSRSHGKASTSYLFLNLQWKCQIFPLLLNLMHFWRIRKIFSHLQSVLGSILMEVHRKVCDLPSLNFPLFVSNWFIQCGFKSMSVIPFKKNEMVIYYTDLETCVLMVLARKRWLGHNLCRACPFYCHLHPSATASYGLHME